MIRRSCRAPMRESGSRSCHPLLTPVPTPPFPSPSNNILSSVSLFRWKIKFSCKKFWATRKASEFIRLPNHSHLLYLSWICYFDASDFRWTRFTVEYKFVSWVALKGGGGKRRLWNPPCTWGPRTYVQYLSTRLEDINTCCHSPPHIHVLILLSNGKVKMWQVTYSLHSLNVSDVEFSIETGRHFELFLSILI